ncbi:MAG: CpaF/VirB11 family protein [Bacilli bacterium]|nr:CpaF/VirB11 family protein [Bacilli bacterium]
MNEKEQINKFLNQLFENENITDISFNGKDIYVQDNQKGRYKVANDISKEEVENYIKQMTYSNNEQFNDENPVLDTEYPNLRINAVHKSLAPYGMTMSLRLSKPTLKINKYDKEIAPTELFSFLEACIKANLNILISGKTGSGKTELQKYLVSFINDNDKIILIEDTLDTHIKEIYKEKDILSWQTNQRLDKPILFEDLIKAGLRNNPDWIIISETRGSEAYAMLKSILSGHKIITTIHSSNCKNSVERLIHMCKEKYNLDQTLLGSMVSELFDIGIHLSHTIDDKGIKRFIVEVVEYTGYDNHGAIINKLFSRTKKVKKINNNYQYYDDYEYGKISKNLFEKLANYKALNKDIDKFLRKDYYEK